MDRNTEIQEVNEKIDELKKMVEDNHRLLKSLYRNAWWSAVFSGIKWVIIIGITIGSFYFFQPYIDSLSKTYNALGGNSFNIANVFKNYMSPEK